MPDTETIAVYLRVKLAAWQRIVEIAELERRDPRHQAGIMLERTAMASRKRVSSDPTESSTEMVA